MVTTLLKIQLFYWKSLCLNMVCFLWIFIIGSWNHIWSLFLKIHFRGQRRQSNRALPTTGRTAPWKMNRLRRKCELLIMPSAMRRAQLLKLRCFRTELLPLQLLWDQQVWQRQLQVKESSGCGINRKSRVHDDNSNLWMHGVVGFSPNSSIARFLHAKSTDLWLILWIFVSGGLNNKVNRSFSDLLFYFVLCVIHFCLLLFCGRFIGCSLPEQWRHFWPERWRLSEVYFKALISSQSRIFRSLNLFHLVIKTKVSIFESIE